MQTKIIEAEGNGMNWGKFLVGRFDHEWTRTSEVSGMPHPLLTEIGWSRDVVLVLDLQTGEGALFRPGGSAGADLDRHNVWVCPLFGPALAELYRLGLDDLDALPDVLALPGAPAEMRGYRRRGRHEALARWVRDHHIRLAVTGERVSDEVAYRALVELLDGKVGV